MRTPFDQVVREHGRTVLRVCRAALPAADADDAWSETFLSALRGWPELAEDANVEAWLVTIARRRCLDVLRRRHPIPVDQPPESASPLGNPQPPEPVWALVAELPQRQCAAITQHYLLGFSYAEAAALLGGTPESLRRAAADGMRTLRRRKEEL
ncbi:sigma-70 family RNA polymerase sigma factor [Naumannella sp. ID2617S]|uniref:RNA polymerase subunit sigma-24 n=1 Tax=Enemella dayhoffiae TaxID=2016507 RepID=A0A255GS84_9ACTN|nr:sigma-70 family RNA polymerase sigma factor [Enemella dayhoffiae]NNG20938.1 sigma-70 family RNA polymerase sigma factor [Naumannella sp. ID2617S]OYO18695.1 RNA polymerase subunit sigma-24 [Enemella dayhoffiae]